MVAQGAMIERGVACISDTLRLEIVDCLPWSRAYPRPDFGYCVSAQGRNGRKQLVDSQAAVGSLVLRQQDSLRL